MTHGQIKQQRVLKFVKGGGVWGVVFPPSALLCVPRVGGTVDDPQGCGRTFIYLSPDNNEQENVILVTNLPPASELHIKDVPNTIF